MVQHVFPRHVDCDAALLPPATFSKDVVFERFIKHFGDAQLSPRHMHLALVLTVATRVPVIEHMALALTPYDLHNRYSGV